MKSRFFVVHKSLNLRVSCLIGVSSVFWSCIDSVTPISFLKEPDSRTEQTVKISARMRVIIKRCWKRVLESEHLLHVSGSFKKIDVFYPGHMVRSIPRQRDDDSKTSSTKKSSLF